MHFCEWSGLNYWTPLKRWGFFFPMCNMQTITSGYPGIFGKTQISDALVLLDWDFWVKSELLLSFPSDYHVYYSLKSTKLKINE